jgi:hypothetical protein
MPESAEILALVERGYLRVADMPAMFGLTQQACSHLTRREDFPAPAKVIGTRRLWRRRDVERWRDAKPRVWTHSGGYEDGEFFAPVFQAFRPAIDALPDEVRQEDVLNDRFLLGKERKLAVYYAPFDWINADARIIILGLTPGWKQTKLGFETVLSALAGGQSEEDAIRAAKAQAAFAGMRRRLCGWLDDLGVGRLAQHLGHGGSIRDAAPAAADNQRDQVPGLRRGGRSQLLRTQADAAGESAADIDHRDDVAARACLAFGCARRSPRPSGRIGDYRQSGSLTMSVRTPPSRRCLCSRPAAVRGGTGSDAGGCREAVIGAPSGVGSDSG